MSLDYEDPSLDRMLTEHARRSRAEFTPPGLAGMLSSALDAGRPRRRWVWPVLAAVLLLAIPLITVLLVRHGRTESQPANPAKTKLVLLGAVPWADPVWTGHAIQFTATLSHAQNCQGAPSIQAKVTADSPTSVSIVATAYVNPDPAAESTFQKHFCADPTANATATYGGAVELPEPWNGRTVIDGTTHTTFRVLDASFVPSIPGLPSIFHSQGYYGHAEKSLVGRSWADHRVQMTLSLQPINLVQWSDWPPSAIGLVNGHPTEFIGLDRHAVAWQNGAYVYAIQEIPLNGTNDYEFSPEQLLNLARGVR